MGGSLGGNEYRRLRQVCSTPCKHIVMESAEIGLKKAAGNGRFLLRSAVVSIYGRLAISKETQERQFLQRRRVRPMASLCDMSGVTGHASLAPRVFSVEGSRSSVDRGRPVVNGPEWQSLLFAGKYLHRPSPAQRANERHRRLHLPGQELYLRGLRGERGHLRNGNAQVVVEPVLVQHCRDGERLGGLIARLALLRHLRRQALCETQPVLHFLEGGKHGRAVGVARLRVLRPGALQLGAAQPSLEQRQRRS